MKKSFLALSILSMTVLAACTPPGGKAVDTEAAKNLVDTYMKLTLGSIPGASVDYERAKNLMTPDFAATFDTPMFIPMTYCIQDGPVDVEITSSVFDEDQNWANVTVEGAYFGGWMHLWDFTVVPTEGDHWMIHKIECSPEMLQ